MAEISPASSQSASMAEYGLTDSELSQLFDAALESSFRSVGAGSKSATYQTILSKIDRFGYNLSIPNSEVTGLTFITRPKLNLTTTNLRQDRTMAMLTTLDSLSFPFALRCLLDTKFSKRDDIQQRATYCPFFDNTSPFLTPLSNCLMSINGFPDFVVDTETTEGGFFSEDQTVAKGSDMNVRTYDLQLTFRDIQGGFITAIFTYWLKYIALVARGTMMAYPEDIIRRRLNYSCSIYRFILDPSRRYITKWAKATGCFPYVNPIGATLNVNERENHVMANDRVTISFKANSIDTLPDPIVLKEFNTLMKRYCPDIDTGGRVRASNEAQFNFCGLPYIDTTQGFNELLWMCEPDEVVDPFVQTLTDLQSVLASRYAAYLERLANTPALPAGVVSA